MHGLMTSRKGHPLHGRTHIYPSHGFRSDLNKHCPKDFYALSNIDKLVDEAFGNAMLSLMDAYSGYNQIKMHPADEDKTTFMTAKEN